MTKKKKIRKLDLRLSEKEVKTLDTESVVNPNQICRLFSEIKDQARESVAGLYMTKKLQPNIFDFFTTGSTKEVNVDPKDILSNALICRSDAFIVIHNHPSGKICPSAHDREFIGKLIEGGKTLDIAMVDFIIIGDLRNPKKKNYWSFFENITGKGIYPENSEFVSLPFQRYGHSV